MKKFLCLVLVLILAMSLFAACSSNEAAVSDDTPAKTEQKSGATPPEAASNSEASSGSEATPPASESTPGESTEVTTSDKPAVYLAIDATDNDVKISYHLEGCSATKGLTTQEIEWSMVETLGFRQCSTCKPPKYEGYIE